MASKFSEKNPRPEHARVSRGQPEVNLLKNAHGYQIRSEEFLHIAMVVSEIMGGGAAAWVNQRSIICLEMLYGYQIWSNVWINSNWTFKNLEVYFFSYKVIVVIPVYNSPFLTIHALTAEAPCRLRILSIDMKDVEGLSFLQLSKTSMSCHSI